LVFGFDNPDCSCFWHIWLSIISIVLVFRFVDVLLWRIYVPTLYVHVEIIELACMIIVVSATVLAPHYLYLDIIESAFAPDMENFFSKYWLYRVWGVKVSIDDFGTGYSSLSVM
jgi:hypothetical protein